MVGPVYLGVFCNTRWDDNWYYSSRSFVTKMLARAWYYKIGTMVQSRKHFDIDHVDVPLVVHAMRHLPDSMKTDACNYVIGKHITNDALGHYVCVGDFTCPLCGGADSREHRIRHCDKLDDIRRRFPTVLRWLDDQPEAVLHFGILPWNEYWVNFSCCDYEPLPKVQRPLETPVTTRRHVFTDGSASFTDCFSATVCAGAWVYADGYNVVDSGGSVLTGSDHSAFRGEIWAVALVQQHYCVTIYTDCASVISICNNLLSARSNGSQPSFGDHEDLWGKIWEPILTRPAECVRVCKVKAHQNLAEVSDPRQHWMATMNDKADQLAKKLVRSFTTGCARKLQQHCKDRMSGRNMLHDFFLMWGAMNDRAMDALKTRAPSHSGEMPVFFPLVLTFRT